MEFLAAYNLRRRVSDFCGIFTVQSEIRNTRLIVTSTSLVAFI